MYKLKATKSQFMDQEIFDFLVEQTQKWVEHSNSSYHHIISVYYLVKSVCLAAVGEFDISPSYFKIALQYKSVSVSVGSVKVIEVVKEKQNTLINPRTIAHK